MLSQLGRSSAARKWKWPTIIAIFLLHFLTFLPQNNAQQPSLVEGLEAPRQRIKNTLGGFYSGNVTLFFRNSPYRVEQELVVESGAVMTIETGVQMFFDTGVGMKVFGTLRAIGNEFAHIQMLPYQEQLNYDSQLPDFRLIDGPSVRQGRLQVRFRDRWRSVCTQVSNWTSVDTGTACRSMGYTDGGFWRFYLRNNDTYPFVMAEPKCTDNAKNLWGCEGFADLTRIPLSENLCQGEDDLGLYCWGAPSFKGWAKHWKGLQIFHSPFGFVPADPDGVAVQRESQSRLEFIDILFAGYDGFSKNTSAALYVEGVPPLMNGLRVERSARDGIHFLEPDGPILLANSTVSFNRGHGIVVENARDGRVFINQTRVEANFGDGIWYKQRHASLAANEVLLGLGNSPRSSSRKRRQAAFVQREKPRAEMCAGEHLLPRHLFFPHLIRAYLANGSAVPDPLLQPHLCWLSVALPARLPYAYTIQFFDVINRHPSNSRARSSFVVCEGNTSFPSLCQLERYRVPLRDGILPQSISLNSNGQPIFLGVQHIPESGSSVVAADVDVLFRVHASVSYKAFYGLNITNSAVLNNTGNGIQAINVRDRTALHNVTIEGNEGLAGLLIRDGAADIWINDTSLSWNWGDGINISYAGGSINVNTSRIVGNRWRGFAFHHNASIPFWPLRQELIIKGRPANNIFYPRMLIAGNAWGGLLVGNFCAPAASADFSWGPPIEPKVLVSWTEFADNAYHPHMEVFACQQFGATNMHVDISGNTVTGGSGMGFRMEPCVNAELLVNSNRFHGISNTALLVRNAKHPQLAGLPAKVTIAKNDIKMNTGQYIVSIGLNEDAAQQSLVFNQQNEVRGNIVLNPFPFLKPRSTPYAALVVSSSNVIIRHNCFGNPRADFEIGTELAEHAKRIDARENNWGDPQAHNFMHRIFDQFNRYSLASIEVNPYAAVCNQRAPALTWLQQYFRHFVQPSQPLFIGGTIFENSDLPAGKYTVTDDLHITPGAKLTLASGTTFEFMNGIGMLVQGELLRNDLGSGNNNPLQPIVFTSRPLGQPPRLEQIRLVDEFGDENVLTGRLEVRLEPEGPWGAVCNRSWTAELAQLACNQMGLSLDPEHFENWRNFPPAGDLPILVDNIRCEEREFDLTRCRHDGQLHNVGASCRPTEVVGLQCAPPYWAGVRFSLLANAQTVTGQSMMSNWVLEKAGLFDFRTSTFSPALQVDWNYHTFHGLTIRDNFHDGMDIVYNDLTRKPAIRDSYIGRNRRNGMVIRSMGLSAEKLRIEQNGNAGVRYLPRISATLQRDIVSWLDRQEQPELEANGVFVIPNRRRQRLQVFESQLDQRKFLVAKPSVDCPLVPSEPCSFDMELEAVGHEYGMPPKLVVQLVNRPHNESDEDAIFEDRQTNRRWSARQNVLDFPLLASGARLKLTYRRSRGPASLVLLLLFLDHQEYLDRFVHVYDSVIRDNQYGVSAVHHSNSTLLQDAAILNRYAEEKLWFQRVNFSRNSDAVIWVHSPEYDIAEGTPLAEIGWHVDNCSVTDNRGPIVDTHRDWFGSANIFHWNFWSNTFANNTGAAVFVHLPDTWDLRAEKKHSFWMTENRFESNANFAVHLSGYYAFANISSNNFTDNLAPPDLGIVQLLGMEKRLVMERNRFLSNWGHWVVRMETMSQSLQAREVAAHIQYNYIQFNHFLRPSDDYAEMWPRSFAVGIFGLQKVDVHFNRLRNVLMDFELVAGGKPQLPAGDRDVLNVTHNWWGVANEAEVGQRLFDLDDWNSLTRADFSPFYTSEELFINFWWEPAWARLSYAPNGTDPPAHDLRGRLWKDKKLELDPERWYPFPYHYRPFRPYRITRDLTIMPGATLTIEKNVEVHVWPNVRILVYGNLVADGTLWQPIRFKPINSTELAEQRGQRGSQYRFRRRTPLRLAARGRRHGRLHWLDMEWRHLNHRRRRTLSAARPGRDDVFRQFPEMRRENPHLQRFFVFLMENGTRQLDRGFLHFYNGTSGEVVPSCDRHFTLRNAQVVCRELGLSAQNAYHWLTAQWGYNPKIRLLKTYMEPRECRGHERRLEQCMLHVSGLLSDWQCMDNEHFNYIHCGPDSALSPQYLGHWGGITFARHSLDLGDATAAAAEGTAEWSQSQQQQQQPGDRSVLRHVEIVGAGRVHNDSLFGAALQVIQRSPVLENVNVTNCSLHAIQIVHPSSNLVLSRLNVSDNQGIGISLLAANLQSSSAGGASSAMGPGSALPRGSLNIAYQMAGLLDICSLGKEVPVKGRLLLFYKYDSMAVDCVKVFRSVQGRNLGFRFLQANFYPGTVGVPRGDQLSVYAGTSFAASSLLRTFSAESATSFGRALPTQSPAISLHLRATAADGEFGFVAEVATLPTAPLAAKGVEEVALRVSRLLNNDRGALHYRNVGELGPSLIVEQCAIDRNGYHLFGNVTTAGHAVELHLHNTMLLLFRANSLRYNRGGLLLSASSASAVSRLNAVLKSNTFAFNSNSSTLALLGNGGGGQRAILLNNFVGHNFALYADTILVSGISANFSRNLVAHNVGWHTVDTQIPEGGADSAQMHFLDNFFEENLALGHGNPYMERYGFHQGREADEFTSRRPKRQVLSQQGVSFDWWTHVGSETGRLRSTVLAASVHQQFARNVFNDPLNDFELTTGPMEAGLLQFDASAIDARHNYWGPPGTVGVASGKIRDQRDNDALIRVDFEPVLESNTSLIEGDCPAGWFQVGHEEFKSCFLFIGASSTYADAVRLCQQLDAFMPILRNGDQRQKELASRVDQLGQLLVTDIERHNSFGIAYDIPIWVASVAIPSNQCGWMSSRTASIGEQNCHNLLPFLCERGTKPYQEPILWRRDFVLVLALLILLLIGIALLAFCACRKAQRKEDNFPRKKQFLRDSIRSSKQLMARQPQESSRDFVPLDAFGPLAKRDENGDRFWIGGGGGESTLTGAAASSSGTATGSELYGSCCRTDSVLSTTDTSYAHLPAAFAQTGNKKELAKNASTPVMNSFRDHQPSASSSPSVTATFCSWCSCRLLANGHCSNCSFSAEENSNELVSRSSTVSSSAEQTESTASSSGSLSASSDSTIVPPSAAKQPLLGCRKAAARAQQQQQQRLLTSPFGSTQTLRSQQSQVQRADFFQGSGRNLYQLSNSHSNPDIISKDNAVHQTSTSRNGGVPSAGLQPFISGGEKRNSAFKMAHLSSQYEPKPVVVDPPDPSPPNGGQGYVNLSAEKSAFQRHRPVCPPPKIPHANDPPRSVMNMRYEPRKRPSMEGITPLETSM